jgi:hypothetical protein
MNTIATATILTQVGQTKTSRNHFGLKTESYFKIEGGPNDGRFVKVYTSKGSSGKVSTNAQVMTLTPATSTSFGSESFMMFQDPSLWLNRGEKVRATEKTLLDQHQRALETLKGMSTDWVNG